MLPVSLMSWTKTMNPGGEGDTADGNVQKASPPAPLTCTVLSGGSAQPHNLYLYVFVRLFPQF